MQRSGSIEHVSGGRDGRIWLRYRENGSNVGERFSSVKERSQWKDIERIGIYVAIREAGVKKEPVGTARRQGALRRYSPGNESGTEMNIPSTG